MNIRYIIIFFIIIGGLAIGTYVTEFLNGSAGIPPEVAFRPSPSSAIVPSNIKLPVVSQNIPLAPVASPRRTEASDTPMNLAVPFQAQAPFADWSLPYQEACEEASLILVDEYFKGSSITPQRMRERILALVKWQQNNLGYYEHTTIYETARMAREAMGYARAEVVENPTYEQIVSHIAEKRPVIVPLAGRLLGNPYYSGRGPVFHMLVVKGVTEKGDIITADVGTRHGQNYVYPKDVFMNAIHDVVSGGDGPISADPDKTIQSGPRRVLVLYP